MKRLNRYRVIATWTEGEVNVAVNAENAAAAINAVLRCMAEVQSVYVALEEDEGEGVVDGDQTANA